MADDVMQFYADFKKSVAQMQKETPDTIGGFGTLFKSVMGEGTLTVAEKECVAVGIAVALQCTPCIRLHVQKALDAGMSRAQILEAASVAVMMSGGPGYTHVPVVLNALDALGAE
jgi:AhpD family alkylhydroperoxidase